MKNWKNEEDSKRMAKACFPVLTCGFHCSRCVISEHANSAPDLFLTRPHKGHHNGGNGAGLLHQAEHRDQSNQHPEPAQILLLPLRPGAQQNGRRNLAEY